MACNEMSRRIHVKNKRNQMKHGSISPCSLYISISRLLIDFALGRSSLFHLLIQVAALAWVPCNPGNPWNFGEGFRNPRILNRLINKYNQTRRLKYKFL